MEEGKSEVYKLKHLRFVHLVQRYIVFDHAPQTVDDGRESDSARCITVAVHFRTSSREIKHCSTLYQGKVTELTDNFRWKP